MTIRELPQPVIACVDGIAAAAGCQLVASCDIAIATNKSFFKHQVEIRSLFYSHGSNIKKSISKRYDVHASYWEKTAK